MFSFVGIVWLETRLQGGIMKNFDELSCTRQNRKTDKKTLKTKGKTETLRQVGNWDNYVMLLENVGSSQRDSSGRRIKQLINFLLPYLRVS